MCSGPVPQLGSSELTFMSSEISAEDKYYKHVSLQITYILLKLNGNILIR